MCTINEDTYFSFTKNMWIEYYGAIYHIMNDDTIIDIKKSIQGSSSIMPAIKKR